jgi:ankyrin repeat protein
MNDALRIHEAFRAGDLATLRAAIGPDFPRCRVAALSAHCLEYAIYHSPLPFVRTLIELGADPNYEDAAGFPSLLAVLSTDRADKHDLLELLLAAGADVQQRGNNDWTPLHYAAARNDPRAIELLAAHGADGAARTRIDDQTTPLEEAERLGHPQAAAALKKLAAGSED